MKILICEDEIGIVKALEQYLKSKGHDVEYALDGKKGRDLIKSKDYGIVFLDINMPELTGVEIIKYIKENNIKTKVIVLTGYPGMTGYFCASLGADEYLEKPTDLEVIGKIVDKYARS